MDALVYTGAADVDAPLDFGWLVGHFKPVGDMRRTDTFEVKWGRHPAGDCRSEWVRGDDRFTVQILVSGRWVLHFEHEHAARTVVLEEPGAYVVWAGVDHSWETTEDTVVITIRAPSVPGFQTADAAARTGRAHHTGAPLSEALPSSDASTATIVRPQ